MRHESTSQSQSRFRISNVSSFLAPVERLHCWLVCFAFLSFYFCSIYRFQLNDHDHMCWMKRERERKKDWNKWRFSIDALFTPHHVSVWLLTIPTRRWQQPQFDRFPTTWAERTANSFKSIMLSIDARIFYGFHSGSILSDFWGALLLFIL